MGVNKEWALIFELLLIPWTLKLDGRKTEGGDISGKYGSRFSTFVDVASETEQHLRPNDLREI